jgi:hypothetical protein
MVPSILLAEACVAFSKRAGTEAVHVDPSTLTASMMALQSKCVEWSSWKIFVAPAAAITTNKAIILIILG